MLKMVSKIPLKTCGTSKCRVEAQVFRRATLMFSLLICLLFIKFRTCRLTPLLSSRTIVVVSKSPTAYTAALQTGSYALHHDEARSALCVHDTARVNSLCFQCLNHITLFSRFCPCFLTRERQRPTLNIDEVSWNSERRNTRSFFGRHGAYG